MEQVEWRPVLGYEDRYIVSSTGEVRSLDVKLGSRNGSYRIKKGKKIGTRKNNAGYWTVSLCRDSTAYQTTVHRVVASAFISNPYNKPQVNHIDGNKNNNHVSNLEWVTDNENKIHSSIENGGTQRPQRAVEVINESTGEILVFDGLRVAERALGLDHTSTLRTVSGRQKSHHGYTIRYAEGGDACANVSFTKTEQETKVVS